MESFYYPQNNARGFLFGIISSLVTFIVAMIIVEGVGEQIDQKNIIASMHDYSGIFFNMYDMDLGIVFAILFACGIIMGVSAKSFIEGIGMILVFFILQGMIFFGTGLLYLGDHYDDYRVFFQDYNVTLLLPMTVTLIACLIGYFAMKKSPRYLIDVSRL